MNVYEKTFRKIAEEIQVLDAKSFRHREFGTITSPGGLVTESVLFHLWRVLYLFYYAGDEAMTRRIIDGGVVANLPDFEDFDFVEQLRAANSGQGPLSSGWRIVQRDGESKYLAKKKGVTLRVEEGDLVRSNGDEIGLRMPSERRYSLLGWYVVMGDEWFNVRSVRLARVYFSIGQAAGAAELLKTTVERLNSLQIPFQLKIANHPQGLVRRDSCVVYIPLEVWKTERSIFDDIYSAHRKVLRDDYPCFALRLASGMSFAEEPDGAQKVSFGQHRCRLVAEALVRSFNEGRRSTEDRMAEISLRFEEEGLDIRRPYLNAQSLQGK